MKRLTPEEFDALKVGDRVVLARVSHMGHTSTSPGHVTKRTAATVTVDVGHFQPSTVRQNGRKEYLSPLTPEVQARFDREALETRVIWFIDSIRNNVRKLPLDRLEQLDAVRKTHEATKNNEEGR